ncbi:hypothetical protein D9758_013424 [Tetrapyrgos nigripes]|uniref:DNA polymerase n=1 Tax=Tetrapyrgos nigripes TaxID=182062 RepID=A0A8H5CLP2_9AGAR|nr:hypothetical protein D9758_013424 [Tetrapyrgos nigripes]
MRFLVACRGYSTAVPQVNHALINMFKSKMEEETRSGRRNGYKIRSYELAIEALNATDKKITNKKQAERLRGIGPIASQMIENCLTGTSPPPVNQRLEEKRRKAKAELQMVPGIGVSKAAELVSEGCYSIQHLRLPEYTELLSSTQKINLRYFEHLREPVHRDESETVVAFIKSCLSPEFEVVLTGSYRRGFPISSFMSVILLHPSYVHVPYPKVPPPFPDSGKTETRSGRRLMPFREKFTKLAVKSQSLLIGQIVPHLRDRGLMADTISLGSKKWVGMIRVPEAGDQGVDDTAIMVRRKRRERIDEMQGQYRRLELNLVPQKSRSAALLSLTGDSEFVRDMRLRANKMGMHLDEFGLWRWNSTGLKTENGTPEVEEEEEASDPDSGSEASEDSSPSSSSGRYTLIPTPTEQSIFDELGIPFVHPEKRNYSYLVGPGKRDRDKPQRMEKDVRAAVLK